MVEKSEKQKTKVIYNRGVRAMKYFRGATRKEDKYLAPGGQVELPEDQANRLLQYDGIVDIKEAPRATDMAAAIASLDAKKAECEELEKKLTAALAEIESLKEDKKPKKEK